MELKRCPFCGGDAVLFSDDMGSYVMCKECFAGYGEFRYVLSFKLSKKEVVEAWNRRIDDYKQNDDDEIEYDYADAAFLPDQYK